MKKGAEGKIRKREGRDEKRVGNGRKKGEKEREGKGRGG